MRLEYRNNVPSIKEGWLEREREREEQERKKKKRKESITSNVTGRVRKFSDTSRL